jgi:hypothetical protein
MPTYILAENFANIDKNTIFSPKRSLRSRYSDAIINKGKLIRSIRDKKINRIFDEN